MFAVFTRTLRERRLSTAIYSFALSASALMYVALYKDFASQLDVFAKNYPENLNAFFGDITAAATPEGWLAIELYSLFLPLILAIVGIGFGASAIGKEENSGTLELLLASPVSRSRIIFQKALAMAVQLGIISFSAWLGVVVGMLFFEFDVSLLHVAWSSLAAWLLAMTYGCLALAAQSVTSKRSVGLGVGAGIVIVTYLANAISQLVDWIEPAKYISPFYYYDVEKVIVDGPSEKILVLVTASAVFYLVAHLAFLRRDTGV